MSKRRLQEIICSETQTPDAELRHGQAVCTMCGTGAKHALRATRGSAPKQALCRNGARGRASGETQFLGSHSPTVAVEVHWAAPAPELHQNRDRANIHRAALIVEPHQNRARP